MSLVIRKPVFCICENKDADQLRGNREADQHLCFCYKDSTIPLLPKSKISSLQPSSVAVQPGFCRTWSEIPKTGFFTKRLIFSINKSILRNVKNTNCDVSMLCLQHLKCLVYSKTDNMNSLIFYVAYEVIKLFSNNNIPDEQPTIQVCPSSSETSE